MRKLLIASCSLLTVFCLAFEPVFVFAQTSDQDTSLKEEVETLNGQVKEKENRLKELEGVINKYKSRINDQAAQTASLQNQLALLENRVKEKELSIERTRGQIDLANLELQRVKAQIDLERQRLARRQSALGGVILELQDAGGVGELESFVARPTLSEFFTRMDELKRVEDELGTATEEVKAVKAGLESKQKELETYRVSLQDQTRQLLKEQEELELEQSAKISLLTETAAQEGEFQRILYELRQQKQEESNDIAALEARLKDKLDSIDEALARGDVLLNWPLKPGKGISAHFHDKTYPFRKLFEHPGVDLPAPVGTAIRASAGGYVAFTRRGKQYGNYIMLVHPGGVATVYAHLSKFAVEPDTYVERGDIIGYSGGKPGDPGAGLSTGPHLHFEVRQDGIPVDPLPFLPSLD